MSGLSQGDLLRALAASAARAGERFVVARNYEPLPDEKVRDVDLVLPPGGLRRWDELLRETCAASGVRWHPGRRYLYCAERVVDGLTTGPLRLDFEPNLNWRGVDFLCSAEVVAAARPYRDGLWVPRPDHECVILLCMSLLHGGFVKRRYVPVMARLANAQREAVENHLRRIFGAALGHRAARALRESDPLAIERRALVYRLAALARGARRPVRFTTTLAASLWFDRSALRD